MARRPRPSLRALLFGCGGGAVLGQRASFLVGSESNVRQWGPWPAGPVRPSGPCCLAVAEAPLFGVAEAPFVRLGGWKTGQTASFLVVQKATLGSGGRGPQARSVPQGPAVSVWRARWPAGPVRLSGPCCFGVASAVACKPGPSFRALLFGCGGGAVLGQTATFLVGSESNVRQWGPWPAGPVRPSGPCSFGVASAPPLSRKEAAMTLSLSLYGLGS